jgi:sugar/nucleoside kinase (ribokinase family)
LTPQGWLREVGKRGEVNLIPWKINMDLLRKTSAIVLSSEDLNNDEKQISQLASRCPILVITENKNGARLYWNGDVRHFSAPKTEFVDDTGAGDIFSAAFFTKLKKTNDPWESVKFAVKLASFSVAKFHLESIPNQDEIKAAEIEIIG